MVHQRNNFDALRLFAALMVMVGHQFLLLGIKPEPTPVQGETFGSVGVAIFFAISGYLVSISWREDPHPLRFAIKRFLRIWPGLVGVTAFCALILGPIVTTLPLADYFKSPDVPEFFGALRYSMVMDLPGVFASNPFPTTVNAPLWTIPLESELYLAVMACGLLWLARLRWPMLIVLVGAFFFHFVTANGEVRVHEARISEYVICFAYGATLAAFQAEWRGRVVKVGGGLAVAAALLALTGHHLIGLMVLLPYAVIAIGEASAPVLRNASRFGDLSYGSYLYGFPVQQAVVALTGASLGYFPSLLLSVVATLCLAAASWHLIEKHCLRLKPAKNPARNPTPALAPEMPS